MIFSEGGGGDIRRWVHFVKEQTVNVTIRQPLYCKISSYRGRILQYKGWRIVTLTVFTLTKWNHRKNRFMICDCSYFSFNWAFWDELYDISLLPIGKQGQCSTPYDFILGRILTKRCHFFTFTGDQYAGWTPLDGVSLPKPFDGMTDHAFLVPESFSVDCN